MDRELDSHTIRIRTITLLGRLGVALAVLIVSFIYLRKLITPNIVLTDYRTSVVELGEVSTTVSASGVITPKFEEVIASSIASRIIAVYANLGSEVTIGMPILELDTTQIELEITNLKDQIELKTVEEKVLSQQHRESVSTLESRKELLSIDLEREQLLEQRYRTLFEQGAVSQFDLDEREINVRKTAIELRQIDEGLLDIQLSAANEIERVSLEKNILQQQLVERIRLRDEGLVKATSNGVITSLLNELGQSVNPGMELVRIANLSNYHVAGTISDFYRGQFYEGLPVKVQVGEEILNGRLTKILPTIDSSGVVNLQVDLDNPDNTRLQPNMRVGLEIITQYDAHSLRASNGIVFNGGGRHEIFTIEGDFLQKRYVELGMVNSQFVEIVDGLALGDKIIISDMSNYMHLDQVAIR